MNVPSVIRPRRELVFPGTVVLFPLLWFVQRDAGIRAAVEQYDTAPPRTFVLALAAVVVSYAVAVVVVAALGSEDEPRSRWAGVVFRPSNGALAALVVLWSVVGAHAVLAPTALSAGTELIVNVLFLWPLLVTILVTYAVGNAVPALQSFALEAAMTVIGCALSAVWLFLVANTIATALPIGRDSLNQ